MPTRDFNELRKELGPEAREAAEAWVREESKRLLVASLATMSGQPQQAIAEALGLGNVEPMDLNDFDELPMSALRRIVEDLGGGVELEVNLPNGHLLLSEPPSSHAA